MIRYQANVIDNWNKIRKKAKLPEKVLNPETFQTRIPSDLLWEMIK